MYTPHPSRALTRLFQSRPYQGVAPHEATFLFVGLDANYAGDIETSPIFLRLLEYHSDGVGFWRKHGVHHPFLLPGYSGDGRRYHRCFARIGFTPAHAELVSFIELLHVPTVGRNPSLAPTDFDANHLDLVNDAILHGQAKHVFLPSSVASLMRRTGRFPWLPQTPLPSSGPFRAWLNTAGKAVHAYKHFSARYAKGEQAAEFGAIRGFIPPIGDTITCRSE